MSKVNNEKGYALVTVLLIVTVLMVFFLSFTGLSMNSVKQNQVVEEVSQSVAVAEMGVSRYQVAIQNIFEEKITKLGYALYQERNYTSSEIDDIARYIREEFPKDYPVGTPILPITGSSVSIKNSKFEVSRDLNIINIDFTLIGTENEEETTLSGKMSIDMGAAFPAFNTITPNCINTPPGMTCQEIAAGGTVPSGNGMENKKFYSNGPLIFENTSNNMNNMQIRGETITFEKNAQHVQNSIIESVGDMVVNGHLSAPPNGQSLPNLTLYVGGSLIVYGKLELSSSSPKEVFVKNGVDVRDSMLIGSQYTVCIKGNIEVPELTNNGKLYIIGDIITPNKKVTNNGELYIKGSIPNGVSVNPTKPFPEDVGTICGPTFDELETVINNVNYN
nr:hypothetical protein [Neobacillus sp. Marseille-Q6967]